MFKVLKYLRKSKLAVLCIILLLVVQAYCDLTLPQYTSNIVNVGIQQGGIDTLAMKTVRRESMLSLRFLMNEEDTPLIDECYKLRGDMYILDTDDEAKLAALEEAFALPMVIEKKIEDETGMRLADIMLSSTLSPEIREKMSEMTDGGTDAMVGMGEMNQSLIKQAAVYYVQSEYAAQGVDTGAMQRSYLFKTGAAMLGFTLISAIGAVLVGLLASRTSAGVGRDLRAQIYTKVMSFSGSEMDKFSTASLITRSTNDVQQIQVVIVMLLRMVLYAPIVGIGGIIKVKNAGTGLDWIIVVAVAAVASLIVGLIIIALPKFKRMQSLVDRVNLVSREILTGIPVIRAFSRERYEEKRFDKANKDLYGNNLFINRVMAFMFPTMGLLMYAVMAMIIWFGAKGVDFGTMQPGDLTAYISYSMQIIMSFMMLTMIAAILPRAAVAAGRIQEVMDTEPVLRDPENAQGEMQNGRVCFENVSFRYPGSDDDALTDISFTAEPGETTAIIGSTGCGKSTLINLIPRFYDVTEGRVTVGGVDVREVSQKTLRDAIGYVPQKGVLFSGDIESNIKFDGEYVDDDTMRLAASVAQATEFIEERPEGYSDPIAQGGTNVSGGQKQRLSIARAAAKKAPIYIFDDSFSALDFKTDLAVRRALGEYVKDATVIIVAQRIATILHANKIVVLDEGRIVGIGDHDTLMRECKEYQEIARSQLSDSELLMEGGEQ